MLSTPFFRNTVLAEVIFNIKGMRKNRYQIRKETEKLYKEIIIVMKEMGTDHCQSWWLNPSNTNLGLKTSEINSRAKKLVEEGFLTIDRSKTSKSTGTCYKLTDKTPSW